MKKSLIFNVNPSDVSEKAWHFIEESDAIAIESLFGTCKTIDEINQVAEELYDEFFGEE